MSRSRKKTKPPLGRGPLPKIIVETSITEPHSPPTITLGGFLEFKNGKKCLRLGDALSLLADGRNEITKSWQPPGREGFDENIYQ